MGNNEKKLRRPRTGRMLAGVCAGLANFFGLDVSLIRVIYSLVTVFTVFAGIPVYILMWIIIPEEKNRYYQHD